MATKIDMIRGLCENIIFLASIDEPITIDGNDVNSSEAKVVAEKILQILDLDKRPESFKDELKRTSKTGGAMGEWAQKLLDRYKEV